jgi:hypothetical protein
MINPPTGGFCFAHSEKYLQFYKIRGPAPTDPLW